MGFQLITEANIAFEQIDVLRRVKPITNQNALDQCEHP